MNKLLMHKSLIPLVYTLFFLLLKISPIAAESNNSKLLIYNAASTAEIIKEIAKEWKNLNSVTINASSASSSSLAKQIINGAPANIYISASQLWIEELKKTKLIVPETIKPIFENKLVLIAPINSSINNIGIINNKTMLENIFNENLTNARISIADPTHVPAGIYTKQALMSLGIWIFLILSSHLQVFKLKSLHLALLIWLPLMKLQKNLGVWRSLIINLRI